MTGIDVMDFGDSIPEEEYPLYAQYMDSLRVVYCGKEVTDEERAAMRALFAELLLGRTVRLMPGVVQGALHSMTMDRYTHLFGAPTVGTNIITWLTVAQTKALRKALQELKIEV